MQSRHVEGPKSQVPEERFEFNEDVEQDWSGMEKQISTSIHPK